MVDLPVIETVFEVENRFGGHKVDYLKTGVAWLDDLMPSGLPVRTSTLLSGPGGSGKPLIGDSFVAAWLRAGGSVVFMSLQYPRTDFIYESLKRVIPQISKI